jgi:hypothetical protein
MASEDDMDANSIASPIFSEYNLSESVRPQSSIRVVLDDDDDESETECATLTKSPIPMRNISDDDDDDEDEDDIIVTMPTTTAKAHQQHSTTRRNGKISIDITDSDDDDDDDDDDDVDDASTADTAEAHGTTRCRRTALSTVTWPMWSRWSRALARSPAHRVPSQSIAGPMAQSPVARELSAKASDVARARERKQLQLATVAHLAKDEALRRADEAAALERAAKSAPRRPLSAPGARSRRAAATRPSLTIQRIWRARTELARLRSERLDAARDAAECVARAPRAPRVPTPAQLARAQAPAGGSREASHRAALELERRRAARYAGARRHASATVTPVSSARKLVRSASLSHLLSTPPAPRDEETTPLVATR